MKEKIVNLTGLGEKLFNENIPQEEKVLIKLKGYHGQGLVITDKKLYVIKWGFLTNNPFAGKCMAFDFKNITALEIKKGFTYGSVEVLSPATQNIQQKHLQDHQKDNVVTFYSNQYGAFQEAVGIARELMSAKVKGEEGSDLNQLEKLAELKEKGIITEEEFDAKKKQILGI